MADNNAVVTRNLHMQITALPLSWHLTAMLQLFTTFLKLFEKTSIFCFLLHTKAVQ